MKNAAILLMLLPFIGLHASSTINPEIVETEGDRIIHYLMTFSYDNAGNTTSIICSLQYKNLNSQDTDDRRSQSLINDYEVSVVADNSWERIVVNVIGANENPTLNVYNLSGVECFSQTMDGMSVTINLSSLKKGVYLFRFSTSEYTKTYKLVKRK